MSSSRRICQSCQFAIESFLARSRPTRGRLRRYQSTAPALEYVIPYENSRQANPSQLCSSTQRSESTGAKPTAKRRSFNKLTEDIKFPMRPTATEGANAKELAIYTFKDENSMRPPHESSKPPDPSPPNNVKKPPPPTSWADEWVSAVRPNPISFKIPEAHPTQSLDMLDRHTLANRRELCALIYRYRDYRPDGVPIDYMFDLYQTLPAPRVCFLGRATLRGFLLILGRQKSTHHRTAERYRSVIRDMQTNRSTILYPEWSMLIDVVGKGFLYKKKQSHKMALEIFADMELNGIKPDHIVLTQLLQSAVRAREFEMTKILNAEFQRRDLQVNIITWTERIREAGKQKDVDKIHSIFRDFCNTGQAIDIVFINALFEAFLTAGQPSFAESIYLRLRNLAIDHFEKDQPPRPNNFLAIRRNRSVLLEPLPPSDHPTDDPQKQLITSNVKDPPLQHLQPPSDPQTLRRDILSNLVPNNGTIRLFITYHCHYTGRLNDVAFYLNEMDGFGVQPTYGTFTDLLHGFFRWHKVNPDWNAQRLDKLFSLIVSPDKKRPLVPIKYVVALASVRAFGIVHGGEGARRVWEVLRPWLSLNTNVKVKEGKIEQLESVVRKFEAGEELGVEMCGADIKWRIYDWRNLSS